MLIQQLNNLHLNAPKTFTTHSEVSGTNVIRWQNHNGFNASWAVQIGETGQEQTEVVLLGTATPAGTAGTLTANTRFEHPANSPIYGIKYDRIVFEVSTAGTSGTAVPITSGTIAIQPDNEYTSFDHTDGSISYAYKTYYRNSVTTTTTSESDWIVGTVPMYALGGIVDRTKSKLWSSDFVSRDEVVDWTNEWNERLNNYLIQANEDYGLGSTSVGFSGTAETGTITAEDFKQIRRVWITENGVDHYQATKMQVNSFLPAQSFSTSAPYFYMMGDNVIGRKPSENSGTAGILYYKLTRKLENDNDLLPVPMRGYTKSYVDYNVIQAQYKDRKISLPEKISMEKALEDGFRSQLTPRSKTGPTNIDLVDIVGGNDIWY